MFLNWRIKTFIFLSIIANYNALIGQQLLGTVTDNSTGVPIEYVNIGITEKNIGTVSNINGEFKINLDHAIKIDTLIFSCIGYYPFKVKIADFKANSNHNISLAKKDYLLPEVIIKPKQFKEKTLGVKSKTKLISAGFEENILGHEFGTLMKVKKTAHIKKVNINIAYCTYDSIFYRLNIYRVVRENEFENILKEPIYLTIPKNKIEEGIQINLESKNIIAYGDFMVSLEHVKNLGKGSLRFSAGFSGKSFYRKTSQGKWERVPAGIGLGINVVADVEK